MLAVGGSRSEVFIVTGVPREHNHHDSQTIVLYTVALAAELEALGVELFTPTILCILILDVPLGLIAIHPRN